MRLFLAVELPDGVKKSLSDQLSLLRREYPQLSWVPKENYHITIEFFGEVDYPERLRRKIEDVLYDQESFYLYAYQLDIFIGNKITLYLNFMRQKTLERIAKRIRTEVVVEQKERKKFMIHLSLARAKIPSKQQYFVLKKRLEKTEVDLEFPVDHLVLYESILGEKAPVYKKIATIPLLTSKKNHSTE